VIARPTKRTKGAALSVGLVVAMVALALPILRVWLAGGDTTGAAFLPLERARRILDPRFHPGTELMSHDRRAIHGLRKAGIRKADPFVGLDVTQGETHRRAPAFLGLCSGDRPDEPVMGWGVILVSGGRLSYLQHGLLQPGRSAEPRADVLAGLLAAYRPVAVASVDDERAPIADHSLALGAPLLSYGVADLLGVLAPRAGGKSLQGATARLLDLGAIPEPPAASTALAAAVVAAFDHPAGAASKKTNVLTLPPRDTARRPPLLAFPF